MPRKGENIYKRKDGRWEGRYIREKRDGKTRYGFVYGRSYREAREKLNTAKVRLAEGKTPLPKAGKVSCISDQWMEEAAVTLKKSSFNKYQDILRCYILPEFGDIELSDITNQNVIDFTNRLCVSGGAKKQGLTTAVAAEVLSVMNRLRIYAMRRNLSVAFSPECVNLKRKQGDIRVFSLEEERKLLDYLKENMDNSNLGILLCLFTGLRVGEVCALNWDDICLAERRLQVTKTVQRIRVGASLGSKAKGKDKAEAKNTTETKGNAEGKGNTETKGKEEGKHKTEVQIVEPKTATSVRTIPLPEDIAALLEEFHVPGAFLLTGDTKRYLEPRTLQNRFKRILAACGIADANFHATRHTFATRCVELGFDTKSLSEILGHASVSITLNRYVHPSMALKEENMNRFSGLLAEE